MKRLFANSVDLRMGESAEDGWFNGDISQVRIYSRALSSNEVSVIYNEEKP